MGKTSKDRRDIYYRLAKEEGWRARSECACDGKKTKQENNNIVSLPPDFSITGAFKLLAIDDHYHILDNCHRIVDLCAAPGSWSQVLSRRLVAQSDANTVSPNDNNNNAIILAVDLMKMSSIAGVVCLQADITDSSTADKIIAALGNQRAQLVLCDGAPDVTNMLDWDEYMQAQLVFAALDLAVNVLEIGGTFISKIYRTKTIKEVYRRFLEHFDDVQCAKPRCCRDSSLEAFAVCRGFRTSGSDLTAGTIGLPILDALDAVPFIVCGDSRYDADRTYPTHLAGTDYEYLPPVQGPLSAPYQALYDRRARERAAEEARRANTAECID